MLQPPEAFDQTHAIGMMIFGRIAEDTLTGAYVTGSHGRRMTGRPRRYYITIPTCNMTLGSNGKAYHESEYLGLTAYSDAEAIEKANARLAKCDYRAEA